MNLADYPRSEMRSLIDIKREFDWSLARSKNRRQWVQDQKDERVALVLILVVLFFLAVVGYGGLK